MQITVNIHVLQRLQQLLLSPIRLARSTLRILVLKMLRLGSSRVLFSNLDQIYGPLIPKCVFTIVYSIKLWYFKVSVPKVIMSTLLNKYLRYVARY